MKRTTILVSCLLGSVLPSYAGGAKERLVLLADLKARATSVEVGVMKPFDIQLVAERDAEKAQISTVGFKLEVPAGLLVVGEELLVESLVALGTPRTGLRLAFNCVEGSQVPIYRFRFVATKPLAGAAVRLVPDNEFHCIAACKDENYATWDCPEAVLRVTAH